MPAPWEPSFSVGDDEIDAQHQHIVSLTASLAESGAGKAGDTVDIVLEHLIRFMDWHFRTEESMMEACGYPLLDQHRAEHAGCMRQLNAFTSQLHGNHGVNVEELTKFFTGYLEQHTLGSDRKYILYIRNRAAKAAGTDSGR